MELRTGAGGVLWKDVSGGDSGEDRGEGHSGVF